MAAKQDVIAVIDDCDVMREAMEGLLDTLGFRTELYSSAAEFIEAARSARAACLIVDVHLGDITGIELVRELAARGHSFPFIIMTGSRDPAVRAAAEEAGCAAFLTKPFAAEAVLDAVEWAIASGGRPRPN